MTPNGLNPSSNSNAPRAKIVLRSSVFRKKREEGWQDLEGYLAKVETRGIASLKPAELQRLPLLYRSVLSSLSVARTIALDRNLLLYLENLALRGYLVVYGPRKRFGSGFGAFFAHDFPVAVRTVRYHILIATLALLIGVLTGYLLMLNDTDWFNAFIPPWLAGGRGPDATRDELLSVIFSKWPGFVETFAHFANYLFSHNTLVGILIFSTGIAAGVPTLILLFYQGLIMGCFIQVHVRKQLTVDFLGWITIHGVTEITAIIIFGAGGLLIADKMLFPDRYSRVKSLSIHGKQAAQLAMGGMCMLFVAAILEGVFRQLVNDTAMRFAIGGATAVLWLAYFTLAGRTSKHE